MKNKTKLINNIIGNTPLIKIYFEIGGKINSIYAKAEWFNLSGSIKDRPALEILKSKKIKPNQTLVETTSGNMGISLCAIANRLGHKVVIFMPKNMSKERMALIKSYNGTIVLCENFLSALKQAKTFAKQNNAFLTNQFKNKANIKAHLKTGKEIINQMKKIKISAFVSGVGTGGTLTGIGKALKKYDKKIKIIALEPTSSPILKNGTKTGSHLIQGISDDFIPDLYDKNLVDKIIDVSNQQAISTAQKLASELGLGVGISSGANVFCAIKLSQQYKNAVITVLPDDNKKYLSTALFEPCFYKNKIKFLKYEVI